MLQNETVKIDQIPLLAAEKHYFVLDEEGYLQYFLYNQAPEHWKMLSANLFRRKLHGFDAATDQQGNVHLLGYEPERGLFYLPPGPAGPEIPQLIYQDPHKKIGHLSVCLDQNNNLHLLILTYNKQYAMWWLFHLCQEQQKWAGPHLIEFGYGPPQQYGLIGADYQGHIFVLYRLFTAGKYNLAYRLLKEGTPRPGKTTLLQAGQDECFFPTFLVDPDNTIHLSWISRTGENMFLNYACRTPAGKWDNFFNAEVLPDSFLLSFLCRHTDKIFMAWKKEQTFFYFYSLQSGKSWQRGKSQIATKELQLFRWRTPAFLGENLPIRGHHLFANAGKPPQKIPLPQHFWPHFTAENKEENEIPAALHILDILTAYTLTRAGNLQAANSHLKQKLKQQQKGFFKLYTESLDQTENLKEKLAAKNIKLKDLEKLLQQTMAELQKHIHAQQKETATLEAQCNKLQKENEKLKKEGLAREAALVRLEERIANLIREKEMLCAEKLKKTSFLSKLFLKKR
ncbi:MAG: hypothetical protein GX334_00605 [Firmicutes bacterium]|nr:hypothetical protein [Bacillota bacterium]